MKRLTVARVEAAIGIPAPQWAMNCYAISCKIVEAKLVDGVAVYGHWYGPIAPASPFRKGGPFTRHGWVKLSPTRVLDATRWVFEAVDPYIYQGPPNGCYDEGGNRVRMANLRPMPAWDNDEVQIGLRARLLPLATIRWLIDEGQRATPSVRGKVFVTRPQAFWLANLPLEYAREHALPIFTALVDAGQRHLIPIDNYRAIVEETRTT